jgi:CubicO group peptidase (beta-lactamase class C family)
MRTVLKWSVRILLALVIAAAVVGFWKREEITRLLTVNSLFDADRIVTNFSSMEAAFLTRTVSRGDGPVSELPRGPEATLPDGVADWVTETNLTSLLVMKDGEIVFEDYYLGTSPDDRRISWSIAKSYLSALFGTAVADGTIDLDAPVTQYAPKLRGSAYDGATVRNVLQMTSGVTFDEDYLDPNSDINKMGRVLALGGLMDDFAAGLTERDAEPGTRWQYVSIDTHVVGMILRGATGRDIADLMSERIIAPLGQEQDAVYVTDGVGVAFVLGGLNITTRDYARFGQMILQNGEWQGKQIVPAEWIRESTAPSAPTEPGRIGYGYQWWIPVNAPEGVFLGRGIYGQYLYIDQNNGVVIVVTAADRQFRERGRNAANTEMMRQIAESLD